VPSVPERRQTSSQSLTTGQSGSKKWAPRRGSGSAHLQERFRLCADLNADQAMARRLKKSLRLLSYGRPISGHGPDDTADGVAGKAARSDLAPVVKELQAAGFESLRAIAAGLDERGIPAARGGKWSAAQVARLLGAAGIPFLTEAYPAAQASSRRRETQANVELVTSVVLENGTVNVPTLRPGATPPPHLKRPHRQIWRRLF
jgi:hypothetical protein